MTIHQNSTEQEVRKYLEDIVLSDGPRQDMEVLWCKMCEVGVRIPDSNVIFSILSGFKENKPLGGLNKWELDYITVIMDGLTRLFMLATVKERM